MHHLASDATAAPEPGAVVGLEVGGVTWSSRVEGAVGGGIEVVAPARAGDPAVGSRMVVRWATRRGRCGSDAVLAAVARDVVTTWTLMLGRTRVVQDRAAYRLPAGFDGELRRDGQLIPVTVADLSESGARLELAPRDAAPAGHLHRDRPGGVLACEVFDAMGIAAGLRVEVVRTLGHPDGGCTVGVRFPVVDQVVADRLRRFVLTTQLEARRRNTQHR